MSDNFVEFPPPSKPYAVALQLFRDYLTDESLSKLAAWRGGWMAWRRTHWDEVDTASLRQTIYAALSRAFYWHETKDGIEQRDWNPDRHKVSNVLEALAAVVHLPSDIDPPAWINEHGERGPTAIAPAPADTFRTPDDDASQVVSRRNGLLDLSTRTLRDHTPALFNFVSVPFDYDPDAPEPTAWLAFLKSVWGDDRASIALLQEYFGYVLSGRLDMQKMLLLVGPIRGGKGTIARMLTALMGGRRNVPGPTLAAMNTNFGLSPLIGKPLAIVSDARLGNMPSHTVVERLLSITGEDTLTIDRKYRELWTGKLPTRFVMLTNELPKFRDSSTAITTRMLILRMTESFLNREALLKSILNCSADRVRPARVCRQPGAHRRPTYLTMPEGQAFSVIHAIVAALRGLVGVPLLELGSRNRVDMGFASERDHDVNVTNEC